MAGPKLLEIDEHLAECKVCGSELDEILQGKPSPDAFSALDLDSSGVDEHLDYELLANFVDGKSDEVDREIVEVHLNACESCSTQIAELKLLRAQINSGNRTEERPSLWVGWFRILIPVAAIVIVGIFAWFILAPRETNIETAGVSVPVEELPPPAELGGPTNTNRSNVVEPAIVDPINDGGRVIGLGPDGALVGLDLSSEFSDKLTRVLTGGSIDLPPAAKGLAAQRGVLMGEGEGVAFSLQSPVGKAIESNRPTFRWERFNDAESYEVDIFDESFNKVASSGKISSPTWTAAPLPRGKVFQWQVTATKDGVETRSPVRPAPDARFLVISSDAAAAIKRARAIQPRSNLLLGIAYAEAGMIEEARAELNALARKNRKSPVPQRLLRSLP